MSTTTHYKSIRIGSNNMKQKYHTTLIVFAIILFIGALFVYFSHGISSEAADPTTSSLASSASGMPSINSSSDSISAETAFLANLSSITRIKIDSSFFSNPLFQALRDNSVAVIPVVPGRSNPFAPVDATVTTGAATLAPVVTSPVTQITNMSAIFNGTINGTTSATSVYFEYGTTPTLGKTTAPVAQSLVSTFVTKVSGLTTGTTYFYRADAKINGVVLFGDIISFTTN
jgi:hypothetical protein